MLPSCILRCLNPYLVSWTLGPKCKHLRGASSEQRGRWSSLVLPPKTQNIMACSVASGNAEKWCRSTHRCQKLPLPEFANCSSCFRHTNYVALSHSFYRAGPQLQMAPLRASPWPKLPLQFQVISPARLIISGCFSSMIKRKPSTSNPWVAGFIAPLPKKHQKLAHASSEQTPNSNSTTKPTIFYHGKYYRRLGWDFFKSDHLKCWRKQLNNLLLLVGSCNDVNHGDKSYF